MRSDEFGDARCGVVVYGSWARGKATSESDVDVLVVLDASAALTRDIYRKCACSQSATISLMNVTEVARKALSACFVISADSTVETGDVVSGGCEARGRDRAEVPEAGHAHVHARRARREIRDRWGTPILSGDDVVNEEADLRQRRGCEPRAAPGAT